MAETNPVLRAWIQKLKAPDPAVRASSIRELELLGDPDSLAALAEVFATDTDPALRAMAQATGKQIYYALIRRQLEADHSNEDERRQAADILAKAHEKKMQGKHK
jgi:hypothetical protein